MRGDAEHPTVHKAASTTKRIFLSKMSIGPVLRNLVLGSRVVIWLIGLQVKVVSSDTEEARASLGDADVSPY